MNIIIETTTGQLVPSGIAPRLPRGGIATVFVQFCTNGVASLLPAETPISLCLHDPSDLETPIATLTAYTSILSDKVYSGQFDTIGGSLAYLERGTLHGRISYGIPSVDSAWFQVLYGPSSQNTVGAPPVQLVIPTPVGMSLFSKVDISSPCLTRTDLATLSIKAGTAVVVGGQLIQFINQTAVSMPVHDVGNDYAVYVTWDGRIIASNNFTVPAGCNSTNSMRIGGYHYGPGGLATAQSGGDETPQILITSIWDLKYRPACADPRGMSRTPFGWVMLYPLNTTPHLIGPSAFGAQIADGASRPIRPPSFGGNGSVTYPDFSRYIATELLGIFGLRLLNQHERAIAAYGVLEACSRGIDPQITLCDHFHTSKYMYQATGNMMEWMLGEIGDSEGYPDAYTTSLNRGDVNGPIILGLIGGGSWAHGESSGSCCITYFSETWGTANFIGARGCCDHVELV